MGSHTKHLPTAALKIVAGAVVGAGAVVPEGKVIAPGTLWMGTPAKYVRDLREDERERFRMTAVHYSELKGRYRNT